MKRIVLVGALGIAALAVSACTTANQQAMAPVVQAMAAGLPYCHVSGSLNAGAGGLAGTGTGVAQNFTFDCPAQPRPATPITGSFTPAATPSN